MGGNKPILSHMCDLDSVCRHILLIDPASQSPQQAAKTAMIACEAGSSAIFVGGSTETPDELVHQTIVAIKEGLELQAFAASQHPDADEITLPPVILFPGGAHALSPAADAILFMMLMNSHNRKYLIGEQVRGAKPLQNFGIETLPTGYLVVSPGGKVGEVGEADLISSDDVEAVESYSLAAKMYGFRLLYLEAGSGANKPVSQELISTASQTGLTIIVGGGIRTPTQALAAKEAGANWIVTGTIAEEISESKELLSTLKSIVSAISN